MKKQITYIYITIYSIKNNFYIKILKIYFKAYFLSFKKILSKIKII